MQLEELFASALDIAKPWKIESLRFDYVNKRLDIHVDLYTLRVVLPSDNKTGENGYSQA